VARLEIKNGPCREVRVVLSRRNLLSLLHKLDMEGSNREIHNNDCFEDGKQCPINGTLLILNCEDDDEHYSKRLAGPGMMHPETETFVHEKGGASGEITIGIGWLPRPEDLH
jgi:hypothetical protein